jgi:hypothetical protein
VVVEHPVLVAKRLASRERTRRWQQENPEKYKALRERRKEANAELQKKWLDRNPGYKAQAAAKYRQLHPGKVKQSQSRSVEKNKEYYADYKRRWATDNKERLDKHRKVRYQSQKKGINQKFLQRRRDDPVFRLVTNLRSRLNQAVRKNQKSGSAVRDLGCPVSELRQKLESQWQSGWSWDNYGTVWVIDHYFPLAWADLEDRIELLAVCNHRNLRALSKQENAEKSNSVCAQAQHLFNTLKQEFGVSP